MQKKLVREAYKSSLQEQEGQPIYLGWSQRKQRFLSSEYLFNLKP